ncbi:hypothetical protein I350_02198 [Cryptococcus amylolentus CBS 6273]|uniref:Uncharacterized protein n=1 Tax=Cryptococcus amylolentus CBS 6273 TaxID=1296118 RepID=A0A1E3K9W9_9TREE|nr:hypothetical protein I350_02198 [Cryptococcus amylolentus CBS 6273]
MAYTLPASLSAISSHSIFVPPPSSSTLDDEWELLDRPSADDEPLGQKNGRVAIRDKDLIVAVGKEVRMMGLGLTEGGWKVEDGLVGSYKTLQSPHLSFPIHHIIVNTTGKLLAVVGHHQLVVVVLPKSKSGSGPVEVHSIPIDEFQFSKASNDIITSVQWHPWGESGNSLWVLCANGKLREYDILQPHDSIQTFDFLPERSRAAPKFTAIDPLSRYATSFAFGPCSVGFSPLIVYCLLANGDIYLIGPVVPLRTEMPVHYLQTLKTFVDTRLARAQSEARDVFGAGNSGVGRMAQQAEWVNALVSQVRQEEEAKAWREEDGEPKQVLGKSALGQSVTRRGTPSNPVEETGTRVRKGSVRVRPPHLTVSGGPAPGSHRPFLRQGPLVFSPGPQEVANGDGDLEEDQSATDLIIVEVGPEDEDSGDVKGKKKMREVVFGIAWSGGRVDIGVETEMPEIRWMSSRDASPAEPVLHIVESILLPFPNNDPFIIGSNAPTFSRDPLYSDVLYLVHAFGMDAISVRYLVDELNNDEGEGELPPTQVLRLVESAGVPNTPVTGIVSFCNITLGYGLLALASTGQVAYIELDIRSGDSSALLSSKAAKEPKAMIEDQSLLKKPFNAEHLVASIRSPGDKKSPVYNPTATLKERLSDSSKPLTSLTSDHLSALGAVSSQIQSRVQLVRSASQTVENRLDLQIQELARHAKLIAQCRADVTSLTSGETLERANKLLQRQESIQKRVEKVLGDLSVGRQQDGELGEGEKKWFDELDRLDFKVNGGPPGSGEVLAEKAQLLRNQLSALAPIINEAKRREIERRPAYSAKQIKPMEAALTARSEELKRLIKRMDDLEIKVEGGL